MDSPRYSTKKEKRIENSVREETSPTGKAILKLLQDCSRKRGMTVVIITHNQALTAMADRIIKVKSGKIASVKMNEQIVPVEEIEW